jgi:hypothetical protein
MTPPSGITRRSDRSIHEALFYNDAEEYLTGTLPFVEDGLAVDEPVLVAVPADNGALLRPKLGDTAGRVRFLDMTVNGRNPGRIIPAVARYAPGATTPPSCRKSATTATSPIRRARRRAFICPSRKRDCRPPAGHC